MQNIELTDEQRVDMVEDQCEHIMELCKTYVEMGAEEDKENVRALYEDCLLYTSPSPRDVEESRMPSSA